MKPERNKVRYAVVGLGYISQIAVLPALAHTRSNSVLAALVSGDPSFGVTDRSVFEVIGTKGVLKMDPAYEMAEGLKSEVTLGERKQKRAFPKRDQFAVEFEYFSDCVLSDKQPEPSGHDGLSDIRIIEALQELAEGNRPVSVKPIAIPRRPRIRQEIAKPPVTKSPRLVHAASPGAKD